MMLDFMKYFRNNNPGANNPGALTDPRTMGDDNQYFSGMPSVTGGALNNNPTMQNNTTLSPPGMTSSTGNARGSSISQPNDQIDFNEMMIRTGGAMMGGAQQGGLAAFNAATDEYGAIQDANRANALERYNTEMTALQKANAAASKNSAEDAEVLAHAGSKLATVKQAIAGLKKYPKYTTGPGAGSVTRTKDKVTGHPRENLRLMMQEIKVDATLANTARTKGAISDREMALFESPIPSFYVDEKIWMRYLLKYEKALTKMYTAMGGSVDSGSSEFSSEDEARLDALIK
jgi:hypothetical protein